MQIAHATLWVADLEESLAFYEAIGLAQRRRVERDGVITVIVGDDGDVLRLRQDPARETPVAPSRADVDHLALAVADVDRAVAAAVDAGGSRLEPEADPPVVEDPAGYTLAFVPAGP